MNNDSKNLNSSLHYYERGYYVKQDYYNGINVAFLYALKAKESDDKFEIYANFGQAKKIWRDVIIKCPQIIELTIAEAYFGLGNKDMEIVYTSMVKEMKDKEFAISSYKEQSVGLNLILSKIKL